MYERTDVLRVNSNHGVFPTKVGPQDGTARLLAIDLAQDRLMSNLRQISSLNLSVDTNELLSNSIPAGSVDHLGLDLGIIRGPILSKPKKRE